MMIFGFLFLLLVVAVLVVGVIAGLAWLNRTNRQGNPFNANQPSEKRVQTTGPDAKRFCSHCGAGLQDDWTHCPQCGAPVGS
jgi:uncharacterized paraquat-inducible protein A